MNTQRIEIGIELLRELIEEDEQLAGELAASQTLFFGGDLESRLEEVPLALAQRRHFEWFTFERPTDAEGVPPAQQLFDRWSERADGETQLLGTALLHSRTGIFEVADVERGSGLWLNDLLGRGSFPVDEPEASAELEVGDLLAGRIFPVGDSQFRLSPAVACFRNPDLREAIRRDLEHLGAERRGTLRIAQIEIERMFFGRGGGRVDEGEGLAEAEELAGKLTALLVEGGVEQERAEAWVESMREAAEAAAGVGEDGAALRGQLLDMLAFDTDVDLDAARELMGPAWAAFARARSSRPEAEAASTDAEQPQAGPITDGDPEQRVAQALANYDRGREAGAGLDQLFDTLERELGLEDEPELDAEQAPDFPGVVGAMVTEFAWECGRERSPLEADQLRALESLAEFCAVVGVFEELGSERLLAFAARWALDRGRVADATGAEALLSALERFARWADREHELELWSDFEETAGELAQSLPRVAGANAALGVGALDVGDPERFDLDQDLSDERLGVRAKDGRWLPLTAPEPVLAALRAGDQVACRFGADEAQLLRAYPPSARRIGA